MAKQRQQHGLTVLKGRVKARGMRALDARTSAVKDLAVWRASIENDLGGKASLSAMESTVVEMIARARLLLDHADAFILQMPSIVNKKRRALYPIIRERAALAAELSKLLAQIGLKRRLPETPDLQTYLADNYDRDDTPADASAEKT
jgi:hypothetical protein